MPHRIKTHTRHVPTPPPVYVDLARTRRRVHRLQTNVEAKLLDGKRFICPHHTSCKSSIGSPHSFLAGTMSHVGKRYDLRLGDKPLRVVVLGQEAPYMTMVSMADRYHAVHDVVGLEKRYRKDAEHKNRNPHMRGTTSALRLIFGKGLGHDATGEWVRPQNGRPFHLFDGFALINRLLCFAGDPRTSQGRATKTMLTNCHDHLRTTLEILEPTILILQGQTAANWTKTSLTTTHHYTPHLTEAWLNKKRVLVCEFSHPSAREPKRWGANLDSPYLIDVVRPTLRSAVRRLRAE
jgi:hypothetical protein